MKAFNNLVSTPSLIFSDFFKPIETGNLKEFLILSFINFFWSVVFDDLQLKRVSFLSLIKEGRKKLIVN